MRKANGRHDHRVEHNEKGRELLWIAHPLSEPGLVQDR